MNVSCYAAWKSPPLIVKRIGTLWNALYKNSHYYYYYHHYSLVNLYSFHIILNLAFNVTENYQLSKETLFGRPIHVSRALQKTPFFSVKPNLSGRSFALERKEARFNSLIEKQCNFFGSLFRNGSVSPDERCCCNLYPDLIFIRSQSEFYFW
jgi:hypothetical protein